MRIIRLLNRDSSFIDRIAFSMGCVLLFLIVSATWIYYPISQGHGGDFIAALSHRDKSYGYFSGSGFFYGPIFALVDRVYWGVADNVVAKSMFVVNLSILWYTFFLLTKTYLPSNRKKSDILLLALAFTSFYPTFQALRQNNIEILEFLFLALMLNRLRNNKDISAGAWLGAAIATKLIPIVLLPYFVWRGRPKLALVSLATLSTMAIISTLIKGENIWLNISNWFALGGAPWPNAHQSNQAISGVIWRHYSEFNFGSRELLDSPRTLNSVAADFGTKIISVLLAFGYGVYLIKKIGFRTVAPNFAITSIETGQVVLLTLLLIPHNHTHYFILVCWIYFIPFSRTLFQGILHTRPLHGSPSILLIISFLLLGPIHFARVFDPILAHWGVATAVDYLRLYNIPFIGASLLFIWLLSIHKPFLNDVRFPTLTKT